MLQHRLLLQHLLLLMRRLHPQHPLRQCRLPQEYPEYLLIQLHQQLLLLLLRPLILMNRLRLLHQQHL